MRSAPKGNAPITISKFEDHIEIGARLEKNGLPAHDPNIGAVSIISSSIRKLGWDQPIVLTNHGLDYSKQLINNKLTKICRVLNLSIEGIFTPESNANKDYWHYETKGEKVGTIFLH